MSSGSGFETRNGRYDVAGRAGMVEVSRTFDTLHGAVTLVDTLTLDEVHELVEALSTEALKAALAQRFLRSAEREARMDVSAGAVVFP